MAKYFPFLLILIILAGCAVNKVSQEDVLSQPNEQSAIYFSFAEAALQQKDFVAAIELYQKADQADSTNIFIKEKLLEIMTLVSLFQPEYQDEIITLGEEYYTRKLYSEKILSILAETHKIQQNYKRAKKFFKLAIKQKPTARNQIAYYLFQKEHDPPADKKLLHNALEFPWKDKKLLLTIAELIGEFDAEKSLDILEKAYERWDDEVSFTPLLTTYEKVGKADKVLALLQQRLDEKKPVSVPLTTYLIGRYFTLKNYDKVIENKDICFQIGTNDILRFLFFAAFQKKDYELAVRTGEAIEQSQDLSEELKGSFYSYLVEIYIATEEDDKVVESLIKCGNIHIIRNLMLDYNYKDDKKLQVRFKTILDSFLVKTETKEMGAYLLAIFHTNLEEKETALEYLSRIPDEFLAENELLFEAAALYLQNGMNIEKARTLLEKLEDSELTSSEIIAGLLFRTQDDSIAYEMLKQEINRNPKPHITTFIRYSLLAEQYGKIDSLVVYLEKGIEIYPDNADLLNTLGYLIAKYGLEDKYDLSEKLLTKALELEPENAMIWDSMAWLHFKKGFLKKALKAMKIPLKSKIEHSEIAYHLGEIFLKLDKREQAEKYLKQAIELANDDDAVEISRKILEKYFKE
jgi:tetratricopeptide (TPR) repeat protein